MLEKLIRFLIDRECELFWLEEFWGDGGKVSKVGKGGVSWVFRRFTGVGVREFEVLEGASGGGKPGEI